MCRLSMLHVAVLWLYLLLPSAAGGDNLLCFFSPTLENELDGTFELILTECPPNEVCYKADGRYGNHSALTARGCMPKRDCSQVEKVTHEGTIYTMHNTCCDSSYCNACSVITARSLPLLITVVVMVGMM